MIALHAILSHGNFVSKTPFRSAANVLTVARRLILVSHANTVVEYLRPLAVVQMLCSSRGLASL